MKPLIIIPARYGSTRFPGKPLAVINAKPMIQHVYERCKKACSQVVIATDDVRIVEAIDCFGGEFVLTSVNHQSGTDRCAEAAQKLSDKYDFDIVLNVQGDEPFVDTDQLEKLIACFDEPMTQIATLVAPISKTEILFNTHKVKTVISTGGEALYFSRYPIPFQRDVPEINWMKNHNYYLHLGMYAYRKEILFKITKLNPSLLEIAEKLEQLRWLENGFKIKVSLTKHANFGIDTPEDLEYFQKNLP